MSWEFRSYIGSRGWLAGILLGGIFTGELDVGMKCSAISVWPGTVRNKSLCSSRREYKSGRGHNGSSWVGVWDNSSKLSYGYDLSLQQIVKLL